MFAALIPFLGTLLDKFFPDATQAQEAKAKLLEMQMSGELQQLAGQLEINKEEAKSTNWFVAGWRPFIGWIGGFGFLYVSFIEPFARFIALVLFHYTGSFPLIDTTVTMQVLFGILGLGAMRTTEKMNGKEGNR